MAVKNQGKLLITYLLLGSMLVAGLAEAAPDEQLAGINSGAVKSDESHGGRSSLSKNAFREKLQKFAILYDAYSEGDNVEALMSLYRDPVYYKGRGWTSKQNIRIDKTAYFRVWPKRQYTIQPPVRVFDTVDPNIKRLIYYTLFSAERAGRPMWGLMRNNLILHARGEDIRIIGEWNELIVRYSSPPTASQLRRDNKSPSRKSLEAVTPQSGGVVSSRKEHPAKNSAKTEIKPSKSAPSRQPDPQPKLRPDPKDSFAVQPPPPNNSPAPNVAEPLPESKTEALPKAQATEPRAALAEPESPPPATTAEVTEPSQKAETDSAPPSNEANLAAEVERLLARFDKTAEHDYKERKFAQLVYERVGRKLVEEDLLRQGKINLHELHLKLSSDQAIHDKLYDIMYRVLDKFGANDPLKTFDGELSPELSAKLKDAEDDAALRLKVRREDAGA